MTYEQLLACLFVIAIAVTVGWLWAGLLIRHEEDPNPEKDHDEWP